MQVFDLTAGNTLSSLVGDVGATTFVGYEGLSSRGRILALLRDGVSVEEAVEGGASSAIAHPRAHLPDRTLAWPVPCTLIHPAHPKA